MPNPEDITRHHEPVPGEDPWVAGHRKPEPIEVIDYDPAWPAAFVRVAAAVRASLGDTAETGPGIPGLVAWAERDEARRGACAKTGAR